MMYPYMTLNDNTEIVHSKMSEDGQVKVYIEKPDKKMVSTMPPVSFPSMNGWIFMAFQKKKWISSVI